MNYIVIPAYQPDNKLIKLIEKIHEKSDFRILVIDDGSSSKCQNIFDKAEQYATVLRHQVNQGKGQAQKQPLLISKNKTFMVRLSQQMRMDSTRYGIFSARLIKLPKIQTN